MTNEKLTAAIISALENMDNGEIICVWNEYCDNVNCFDDRIEYMEMLPELFDTGSADGVWNLLNRFYFGSDCYNPDGSANPNRDYFYFNGYGNIVSTDYPRDVIDVEELAEWIIDHDDALYNDELRDVLDSADDEEQEG